MTIKPNKGDFKPKKAIDQKVFKTSCAPKKVNAFLFFFFQTRNKATPIKKYKEIHTGPNSQLGGLNDGFIKVEYQVETDLIVKNEPITPAS